MLGADDITIEDHITGLRVAVTDLLRQDIVPHRREDIQRQLCDLPLPDHLRIVELMREPVEVQLIAEHNRDRSGGCVNAD